VSGLDLLAPVSTGQRDALRATLLDALRLPLYAEAFNRNGIAEGLIRAEPLLALARLPLFAGEMQSRLAREALERRRFDLGGVELSSGTGGVPKRRVLSEEDVALDAALLTRLLHLTGVQAGDRVVAMELSVTPLAAAFLEGCERLGVRESAALAWRPGGNLSSLHRLAPSVLIAPPSLLTQVAPLPEGLRLVIYNGDRLDGDTAARLRAVGVGVRSLYGLTETSALGISCVAECGIHLSPEQALFDLRPLDADHELIVTTLGYSMPLLRYPTGDRVRPLWGACPCGSTWPRIEVLGRIGNRFALFEIELSVDELAAYLDLGDAPLQVALDDGPAERVRMTLRLGAERRDRWRAMRKRLSEHPLLGYLMAARLIQVHFRPLQTATGRKPAPLVDRRGGRTDGN
jgi:phenylacetate-coenzyme A ligase PaaK-like adenylate-forming protein